MAAHRRRRRSSLLVAPSRRAAAWRGSAGGRGRSWDVLIADGSVLCQRLSRPIGPSPKRRFGSLARATGRAIAARMVTAVAVFFVGMGILALAAPERIAAIFGTRGLTAEGRNEVRAVYGGFGIAVGALLIVTTTSPALQPGVYAAVAASLGGMAAGRLVAAVIERPGGFYPCWFYCLAETLMAAVLLAA